MSTEYMIMTALQAAGAELSKGDIILRTFIGMIFIMTLMFLAVIVTGRIGKMRERQQDGRSQNEENEIQTKTCPPEDDSDKS